MEDFAVEQRRVAVFQIMTVLLLVAVLVVSSSPPLHVEMRNDRDRTIPVTIEDVPLLVEIDR
jgi:hypothetical protein